jgi:hypothetical protein
MPEVDIIAESWLRVSPNVAAPMLREPERLLEWFPELELTVFMDRGEQGTRWSMAGALLGSMEVWLEGWREGCIVHWYVRGDVPPVDRPTSPRRARIVTEDLHTRIVRHMHAFKDRVESATPR